MTALRHKTRVSDDHQIRLDLTVPADIPPGEVDVLVLISGASAKRTQQRRKLSQLAGRLANSRAFAGDAVTIQRELRDEW